MPRPRLALVLAASLLLATLFPRPGAAEELVVSAAASLTSALTDVKKAFEAEHPGLTVFVNFAASYEQVLKRNAALGVSPARSDAAAEIGKTDATVQMIFDNLNQGFIDIMPAINEVAQIWTPGESFLIDLCTDAYRSDRGEQELYATLEDIQKGLERMVQQIHDAIFTLA